MGWKRILTLDFSASIRWRRGKNEDEKVILVKTLPAPCSSLPKELKESSRLRRGLGLDSGLQASSLGLPLIWATLVVSSLVEFSRGIQCLFQGKKKISVHPSVTLSGVYVCQHWRILPGLGGANSFLLTWTPLHRSSHLSEVIRYYFIIHWPRAQYRELHD